MIFVHIPKTAGTSFHAALAAAVAPETISAPFAAFRFSTDDVERMQSHRVISGHISIADADLFPGRRILSILRDPIDRCVSWYYYAHSQKQLEGPADVLAAGTHNIRDFFALDPAITYRNIVNRQTRQLGGHVLDLEPNMDEAFERAKVTLRRAAWIGCTETLDRDIPRLRGLLPHLGPMPTLNTTAKRSPLSRLDADVLARIAELNRYDLELYEFARRLAN